MNIGDQLTERVKKIRAEECLWDSETGYSPQNTNTPSRFGQFNVANLNSPYGCSLSDLQPSPPSLPDINDKPETPGLMGMISVSDGCGGGGYSYWGSDDPINGMRNPHITFRPSDSTMETEIGTEDCGNYTITYGYDQYGNPIAKVTAKSGGSANTAKEIEKGLNDAIWDLNQEGYFQYNELGSLIKDVASFMSPGGWGELANVNKAFKDPYTAFYHVTIGAAIASEMGLLSEIGINWSETGLSKKEFGKSGRKWTEKDLKTLIGTAVSFENKNWNTQLGFYYSSDVWGQTSLGLVDVGNLILATIKYESTSFNPESVNYDTGDVGLMQKNIGRNPGESKEAFRKRAEAEGWFNPFKSVLWGVGGMFNNLKTTTSWPSAIGGPPTQYEWM
ncbi:hypothetical protein LLG10_03560, partial [bacterium]|nr:hypothetical protein [bacterium]